MLLVHAVKGIAMESFGLLERMAPYLLFGFLFAGIIHIFLSPEKIARHLGKGNFASVIKASLFGVPLPLCSCGVIPAALSLRKEGASIGAVLAFLISTPTTGIDSIFATYSLMGGLFTAYRIIASFGTGVLAGLLANALIRERGERGSGGERVEPDALCCHEAAHGPSMAKRVIDALRYGFVDLFDEVSKWLLVGIIAGGAISFFVPEGFFSSLLGLGWSAYILMFLIGTPMYVCATGSIPIAASLMAKGVSPGAAFVFLVSGPATNTVAISVMMKQLGKKAVGIYLGSIFFASVTLGFTLDKIWAKTAALGFSTHAMMHSKMLPEWVERIASFLLLALIAWSLYRASFRRAQQAAR